MRVTSTTAPAPNSLSTAVHLPDVAFRVACHSGRQTSCRASCTQPLPPTWLDNDLGWNLDLRIKARTRLPLLLHQLAKTGQDKFAVLFNLFVGERAERIEKYSSGFFVGLASASAL